MKKYKVIATHKQLKSYALHYTIETGDFIEVDKDGFFHKSLNGTVYKWGIPTSMIEEV